MLNVYVFVKNKSNLLIVELATKRSVDVSFIHHHHLYSSPSPPHHQFPPPNVIVTLNCGKGGKHIIMIQIERPLVVDVINVAQYILTPSENPEKYEMKCACPYWNIIMCTSQLSFSLPLTSMITSHVDITLKSSIMQLCDHPVVSESGE